MDPSSSWLINSTFSSRTRFRRMTNGTCKTHPSTSLNSHLQDTDNDMMIAVVLSEEYNNLGAHGAFARDLCNVTKMTNEQLLPQRLNEYGMREVMACGDGNCQFSALSEQIYGSARYHKDVRRRIVKQMRHKQSMYQAYVPMKYKDYCKRMKRGGEWGDHINLQAAADRYEAKICVLTSSKDHHFTEVVPQHQPLKPQFWLSFYGVHYNSLHPI